MNIHQLPGGLHPDDPAYRNPAYYSGDPRQDRLARVALVITVISIFVVLVSAVIAARFGILLP